MNWIFSGLFLIFIFNVYKLVGDITLEVINIKRKNFAHKVLVGFTIISLLQWVVGFFSQLYHVSWTEYMLFMISGYIVFCLFIVLIAKKNKYSFKKNEFKEIIFSHIKEFWLIYTVCGIFSFFSMTSQLPYLEMNYDDYYYIGRMIQEIGANQLAMENYYMGSNEVLPFDRIITTYEITYGFWSQIFNISPAFFARATMVIHNYFMAFLSFYFIGSIFIKNKKYTQYTIFILFILMIPAGYLAGNNIIDMYDGWQFNTAIWYGGSIVRVIGIPLLLMCLFIAKHNIKYGILSFLMVSIVLVSYSAIAVTTIFLFFITTLVVFFGNIIFSNKKMGLKLISVVIIVLTILFLVLLNNIDLFLPIDFVNKIQLAVDNFNMNNNPRLEKSMLLYISLFCSIMLLFISDRKQKNIIFIVLLSVLFFYVPFLTYALSVSTTGYFFVISRAFTSIQILLLLFTGIFFVKLVDSNYKKIIPIATISLLAVTIVFQVSHLQEYKNYVYLGSGISTSGYSLRRLIENPYMIPKVFVDFGKYFSQQQEERYQIVSPHVIQYEGGNLELNLGMIMSSNNVEICNSYRGDCMYSEPQDKKIINQFLDGDIQLFEEFEYIKNRDGIDYAVTNNLDVLGVLIENNYPIAYESVSLYDEKIYLIDLQ